MTLPSSPSRAFQEVAPPSGGGVRLAVAAVLVAIGVLALNAAVLFAVLDRVDAGIFAVQAIVALLLLGAALLHVRQLTRERRRYALGTILGDLAAEPSAIEPMAQRALSTLIGNGVADVGLVALAADDADEMRPIAAMGYQPRWLGEARPRALPAGSASVDAGPVKQADPWTAPVIEALGSRPWVARIPLISGGNPIGLLLLASRRRRVLDDELLLERFGGQLVTALDHAATAEASCAREQRLETLDQQRREFIAALAHEVRTPLTSIQAFADLLQLQPMAMDETAEQLVNSLNQGVQRLNLLVNDLLDLGQSEAAGFEVSAGTVELGAVFARVEALVRPALLLGEQSLAIEIEEGSQRVDADQQRLERVLLNLVSNANRYTPIGGAITLRATGSGDSVRIEVEDSGEGVPDDLRERIFDPYFRVDRDEATVHGSGLGLAVARQLIELQSGRIWVEASPTGGARFCVELPRPAADVEPAPTIEGD